jgi:hypothetical protein
VSRAQLGRTEKGRAHLVLTWNYAVQSSLSVRKNVHSSRPDYKKGKFVELNEYFASVAWINLLSNLNTNDIYEKFRSIYSEGLKLHVPMIKKTQSFYRDPWITKEVIAAIKTKNKLYYRSKDPGWRLDVNRYNNCCKDVKKSHLCAFIQYEKMLASKSKSDPKLIYQYINKKQKVNNSIRSIKNDDGDITTDTKNIAMI